MAIKLKVFNASSYQDLEAQFTAWSETIGDPFIVRSDIVVVPVPRDAGHVSLNFTLAVFFKPKADTPTG
jgi:hypothetical protein